MEDDLDQAHLIKFLLEDQGRYAVTLAQDGLRGSLLVRDSDWDLVITDLNLPGVDGMAVVEAARTTQPDTPILATTGYSGPQYAEEALRKGATDVLIKPLEKDELLAKVEALVRRRGPLLDGSGPPAPPVTPIPTSPRASRSPPEERSADQGPRQLRVLAVSVRPGDAEAGCGGTLLRDRGDRVILLTLTHGHPTPPGVSRRDHSKAAGRAMGIRFFVGNAGSGDEPLEDDLRRLVRGALTEIRPDLVYVPTLNHPEPSLQLIQEDVMSEATGAPAVYAYDPGDSTPDFHPTAFVRIATTLDQKLEALDSFDASGGAHLSADRVALGARFWGRFEDESPAEPFEVIRGDPPSWLGAVSLLPAEESKLV